MMKNETPTGKTQAELDNDDSILSSLSNIAYSDKSINVVNRTRNSRFWFKIETTKEIVKVQKEVMLKKALTNIDQEVESRLVGYRKELSPELKTNIEKVREFFLTEVAPLTLASSAGSIQSQQVVQRLLDSDVDSQIFARFDNMVNRAATLKMANFVASYFGLEPSNVQSLIGTPQNDNQDFKALMKAIQSLPSKGDLEKVIDEKAKH